MRTARGQEVSTVSALLQEQGCSFASFISFPLTALGAKLGPCLVEMLSPLKSERSRKTMCCHALSLHPRNIGEFSPFFPPSKREVLQTAGRHRIDGGAVGYSYGRYCEMTFKKYLPIFPPPHSFCCCAGREGEAAWLGLHSKGTVACPGGSSPHQRGARASCAHKRLESSSRAGQVVGAAGACTALWNGARVGLVRVLLRLCPGSLPLRGSRGLTLSRPL